MPSSQVKVSTLPVQTGESDCSNGLETKLNGVKTTEEEEDIKDPACDPDNPVQVKFQDVSAAAYKIRNGIQRTPCQKSRLSEMLGLELTSKGIFSR